MRILPNILFLGRGLSVVSCFGGFDYKVLVGEGAVEGEFGEHLVDVPMWTTQAHTTLVVLTWSSCQLPSD